MFRPHDTKKRSVFAIENGAILNEKKSVKIVQIFFWRRFGPGGIGCESGEVGTPALCQKIARLKEGGGAPDLESKIVCPKEGGGAPDLESKIVRLILYLSWVQAFWALVPERF